MHPHFPLCSEQDGERVRLRKTQKVEIGRVQRKLGRRRKLLGGGQEQREVRATSPGPWSLSGDVTEARPSGHHAEEAAELVGRKSWESRARVGLAQGVGQELMGAAGAPREVSCMRRDGNTGNRGHKVAVGGGCCCR